MTTPTTSKISALVAERLSTFTGVVKQVASFGFSVAGIALAVHVTEPAKRVKEESVAPKMAKTQRVATRVAAPFKTAVNSRAAKACARAALRFYVWGILPLAKKAMALAVKLYAKHGEPRVNAAYSVWLQTCDSQRAYDRRTLRRAKAFVNSVHSDDRERSKVCYRLMLEANASGVANLLIGAKASAQALVNGERGA